MKNRKYIYGLLVLLLAISACKPEEYEMGSIISKEDLKYSITQNASDPNMVLLESLTPAATPMWVTPQGRSTALKDTVLIPFAGEYKFVYGVTSAGGFVQADTFTVVLTTDNLDYVNDPLWTMLTGGAGNSKTWVMDLFPADIAPANCKYFVGPQYFWGTGDSWTSLHMLADGMSREEVNAELGLTSATGWNWDADWPGASSWLFGGAPAEDYGTMTFDLIGGPHLNVNHFVLGRQESGTYMFDAKNKTMRTTDATILHAASQETQVSDWTDIKVMSLTENTLQLGVVRTEGDPALLVFNFISKEYSDNWVAPDQPDPEPQLPDGWMDDISQTVNTVVKWKLSEENPLDWTSLDGTMLNGFEKPEDYPDWLGTPDPAVYGDFSMTMDSKDGSVAFVTPDGTTSNGTYSIDEKGIYSFDIPVPTFTLINWANFGPDANNQLRIVKIEKDAGGNVTGMWLGAISADKPEYMAYHLIPQAGGGGGEEPTGTELAFDNLKLVTGDLEGKGNLRLELYNDFGSTKANPPLDPASVVVANRLEVTFTISGATLTEGAAGNYATALGLADADWSVSYWGGGAGDTSVTGNGTYTVYADVAGFETALVFVIDIVGIWGDLTDNAAVTATIDKVVLY